ncbi:MAG: cytochrome c3 family protein [Verrucomicrobiota bacterium JB023]|nr:cytochrome c3 family protein [Verrucomicrobiota bacterium JB023]
MPLKLAICAGAIAFGIALTIAVYGYGIPHAQPVGYQPGQPIPYSHEIHVNQLGMDCRYCHSFVEHGAHANVPSANVCFNCHGPNKVKSDSPLLAPLYDAMAIDQETGQSTGMEPKTLEWVRVHKIADYAYFNHSAHVNRGVSCQSCHGEVDEMKKVYQAEDLTMGWCLDCHRSPEKHLRPMEEVFNLDYDAEEWLAQNEIVDSEGLVGEKGQRLTSQEEFGKFLKVHWDVQPKESCATCHR